MQFYLYSFNFRTLLRLFVFVCLGLYFSFLPTLIGYLSSLTAYLLFLIKAQVSDKSQTPYTSVIYYDRVCRYLRVHSQTGGFPKELLLPI
jgi:hypothetical protein